MTLLDAEYDPDLFSQSLGPFGLDGEDLYGQIVREGVTVAVGDLSDPSDVLPLQMLQERLATVGRLGNVTITVVADATSKSALSAVFRARQD